MGALLQRVGLQKSPSQALVQAPSADLIKSDNEFGQLPKKITFDCMPPEEFKIYSREINSCTLKKNPSFLRETIIQKLQSKGMTFYLPEEVDCFLEKQARYYKKINEVADSVKWRQIITYQHPIPLRIIQLIKDVDIGEDIGELVISDIDTRTSHTDSAVSRNLSLICFLALHSGNYRLIIDAWRGPTFSDEEARI